MTEKFIYRSKTFIGGLIMLVNPVCQLMGVDPFPTDSINEAQNTALSLIDQANEFIGFVLVVLGRWKAGGVRFMPTTTTNVPPAAVIALMFLLGGCAQAYGVTHVKASFAAGELTAFEWTDGKEKASVTIARGPDGSFYYSATDVLAFDGQKIGAEVYEKLAEVGVNVTKSVVVGAVTGALGGQIITGAGALIGTGMKLKAASQLPH